MHNVLPCLSIAKKKKSESNQTLGPFFHPSVTLVIKTMTTTTYPIKKPSYSCCKRYIYREKEREM